MCIIFNAFPLNMLIKIPQDPDNLISCANQTVVSQGQNMHSNRPSISNSFLKAVVHVTVVSGVWNWGLHKLK
jgi:hypothetical protein